MGNSQGILKESSKDSFKDSLRVPLRIPYGSPKDFVFFTFDAILSSRCRVPLSRLAETRLKESFIQVQAKQMQKTKAAPVQERARGFERVGERSERGRGERWTAGEREGEMRWGKWKRGDGKGKIMEISSRNKNATRRVPGAEC